MDKDLLKSLNNLSEALQTIADFLEKDQKDKEQSPITTALKSIDRIETRLRNIDMGVKKLIKSNKEIAKDQKALLEMSRNQAQRPGGTGSEELDSAGDKTKKSKLMDGVKMILLIAMGVLAIGLAFQVIGKVNFLSVIALAVALPLIAVAIQRLVESEVTPAQAFQASLVMIAASFGIMGASFFLSAVRPLSFGKIITTVMIAVAFYFVGTALAAMIKSMMNSPKKKVGPFAIEGGKLSWDTIMKGVVFIPLIMVAMSVGIVLASAILSGIVPTNIFKLFTAIMIAVVFAVIANSIGNLIAASKKMKPQDITRLPMLALTIVAVCAAIVIASYLFQAIVPIGIGQFLTAVAIAVVFYIIAKGLTPLVPVMKKLTARQAENIGRLLVILAAAIVATSWIMLLTAPVTFGTMFKFVVLSVAVSASILVMGLAIFVLDKLGVTKKNPKKMMDTAKNILIIAATIATSSLILSLGAYSYYPSLWWTLNAAVAILAFGLLGLLFDKIGNRKKFVEGSKVILIVAITIALTSRILSLGDYDKRPSIFWTFNVLVSIVAFAAVALVFGYIMMKGMAKYLSTGLLTIVAVSLTILAVSRILSFGNYTKYPGIIWTFSTLLSISAFALVALPLGAIAMSGIGAGLMLLGLVSMIAIAGAITLISIMFNSTEYTKYPGIIWTTSVLFTIGTFALVAAMYGLGMVGTLGAGAAVLALGFATMLGICYGINQINESFSSTTYDKFPSLTWTGSVLTTIGLFAAAAAALGLGAVGTLLVGPALMLGGFEVMKIIAGKIVELSNIFATGNFEKGRYPSLDWALGVSIMLRTMASGAVFFGMVYSTGVGKSILEAGMDAMSLFATGIVRVSNILAGGNYQDGPTETWSKAVSMSINAFAPVYKMLQDSSGFSGFFGGGPTPEEYTRAIETIVSGIVAAANKFSEAKVSFQNPPPESWARGVSKSIGAFAGVFKILADSKGYVTPQIMKRTIRTITEGIIESAKIFNEYEGEFKIEKVPSTAWSNQVAASIRAFKPVLSMVSKQYGSDTSWIKGTIKAVGEGMKEFATVLTGVTFPLIPPDFAPTTAKALTAFKPLLQQVGEQWTSDTSWIGGTIASVGYGMSSFANSMKDAKFNMIPDGWAEGIAKAVATFSELLNNPKSGILDWMRLQVIGYSFTTLSNSINEFAQSINKLSSELQNLDVEKLNAINRLTGSVVLLSLMDSNQFTSMMEALEEKTEGFINILNEMDKSGGGVTKVGTSEVKPGAQQPEKTIDDLVRIMTSVDAKMTMIYGTVNNISTNILVQGTKEVDLNDKQKQK